MPPKPAEIKKALLQLIGNVEASLSNMDLVMKTPSSEARGNKIAQVCNDLELSKDLAKQTLGLLGRKPR